MAVSSASDVAADVDGVALPADVGDPTESALTLPAHDPATGVRPDAAALADDAPPTIPAPGALSPALPPSADPAPKDGHDAPAGRPAPAE